MKELRFYLANPEYTNLDLESCSDELFINASEKQGTVFSINGFNKAFNDGDISTSIHFLRIMEINEH